MIEIQIFMDHAVVAGTRVERPASICRSEWMRQWELMVKKNPLKIYQDGRRRL